MRQYKGQIGVGGIDDGDKSRCKERMIMRLGVR